MMLEMLSRVGPAGFYFHNGLIDQMHRSLAMAALVVLRMLERALCRAQMLNRLVHLLLP
jgi:hypothetical protein